MIMDFLTHHICNISRTAVISLEGVNDLTWADGIRGLRGGEEGIDVR